MCSLRETLLVITMTADQLHLLKRTLQLNQPLQEFGLYNLSKVTVELLVNVALLV